MLGWNDVSAEKIAEIREKDFEDFCAFLIRNEAEERHAAGITIDGPGKSGAADGGVDILVRVRRGSPPIFNKKSYLERYPGALCLTPDQGRRAFSCKTGAKWKDKILEESIKRGQYALETLNAGGSFWLITNTKMEARDKPQLRANLARNFNKRSEAKGINFTGRIKIVDANDLLSILQARKPNQLPQKFASGLGIGLPKGCLTIGDWTGSVKKDRDLPVFHWDQERENIRDRLRLVCNPSNHGPEKKIILFGSPGVGKTRLILEALREQNLEQRTLIAQTPEDGHMALREERVFQKFPGCILVVDDCPPNEIERLLLAAPGDLPRGALIILVPSALHGWDKSGLVDMAVSLEPLDEDQCKAIFREILGATFDEDELASLAHLAGGFPWFAHLLARELKEPNDGKPAERHMRWATRLVLASKREQDWHEVVMRRARVLLAIMLTSNRGLFHLGQEEREDLIKAVGLSDWKELESTYGDCSRRGLLRERASRRFIYVTPHILEREVLEMLLNPGPGGPEPLGKRLLSHGKAFLPVLLSRLPSLGLERSTLEGLARDILWSYSAASGAPDTPHREVISFLADQQPGYASRLLAELSERAIEAPVGQLRVPLYLPWQLEKLTKRATGFEQAESALYLLANSQDLVYLDARKAWANIFSLRESSYQSVEARLSLLERRARGASGRQHETVMAGLSALLHSHAPTSEEGPDGPFSTATPEQMRGVFLGGWRLLFDLVSQGADGAQKCLVKSIERGILDGSLLRLEEATTFAVFERLDESIKVDLRRNVQNILEFKLRSWDTEEAEQIRGFISRLLNAIEPVTFEQKIQAIVGNWKHRSGPEGDLAPLAREGLAPPEYPMLASLPWLASKNAVRGGEMARELGREDERRVCLRPLVDLARRGQPLLLAAYLEGWAGLEPEVVHRLLQEWAGDDALAPAAVLAILFLPPVEERVRLLVEALAPGRPELPEDVWQRLSGRWLDQLPADIQRELLGAMLARGAKALSAAVLSLLALGNEEKKVEPWRLDTIHSAMSTLQSEKLGEMDSHAWNHGGLLLLRHGRQEEACRLALARVLKLEMSEQQHWELIMMCENQAPLIFWGLVRPLLEGQEEEALDLAHKLRLHNAGDDIPGKILLDWCGHNEGRGRIVAELVPPVLVGPNFVARDLVARFGPSSAVAQKIGRKMATTYRAVPSLGAFFKQQRAKVVALLEDPDPGVRSWARELAEGLGRSAEFYDALEEFEHRRVGT